MHYPETVIGTFLERPNRFIAKVLIDGKEETVHVKNTGRCKELLMQGVPVALAKAQNPNRKTGWDLVAVKKEGTGWINIDSQACNAVMAEYLRKQGISFKQEVKHDNSRFDFLIHPKKDHPMWMEVKGCTLESRGIGYFPDAPTSRGAKHVQELSQMAKEGASCALCFVIQMDHIHCAHIMDHNDPKLFAAIQEAKKNGVRIFHALCHVSPDSLNITKVYEQKNLF